MTPPEVPCRIALPDEVPSNAIAIAKLAGENGWHVKTTYARGTMPTAARKVVDSVAVRIQARDRRYAAIWIDGKFWRALSPYAAFETLADFKSAVRGVAI